MSRQAIIALALLAACREGDAPAPAPSALSAALHMPLTVRGRKEQVGFDTRVTLQATVGGSGAGRRWRYRWTQVFGRAPVALGIVDDRLELLTPPPPSAAEAERWRGRGVVALSAHAAGRMVFRVEAEDESGTRLTTTVEVIPAFPTAGWPRLPLNVDVYLPGPHRSGPNAGWTREGRIELAPTRFPHLTLARGGEVAWYTLADPEGRAHKLRGGVWLGGGDCGRFDCHPGEHRGWQRTAHATVLERGLSGELPRTRGRYQEHCIACHSVGHQPGVGLVNDGFDDRASEARWFFPPRLSREKWAELPQRLKERANVQCESCHGPGWFYTGYGDDICAQCHDLPPRYLIPAQARLNRMREAERALAGAGFDAPEHACRGCHVGAEALRSLRGHRSTSRPGLELDERPGGITCAVCHDPHGNDCPKQLRVCGEVEIPGRTLDAGQGALCIACHSGEVNVVRGPLLRPFVPGLPRGAGAGHATQASKVVEREREAAPHAPQFQILTGRGGKFLRLPDAGAAPAPRPSYPHMLVPSSCVGCHYSSEHRQLPAAGHSFKLLDRPSSAPRLAPCSARVELGPLRSSTRTETCARCHGRLSTLNARARGDYDGDGELEGIVEEIGGLLVLLRDELARGLAGLQLAGDDGARGAAVVVHAERLVVADAACAPLRAHAQPLGLARAPLLEKAAFNLLMVLRDGSGGIHNPQYVVTLLQSTIVELERSRSARVRHGWKSP